MQVSIVLPILGRVIVSELAAATPSDISCETPKAMPESPKPASELSCNPLMTHENPALGNIGSWNTYYQHNPLQPPKAMERLLPFSPELIKSKSCEISSIHVKICLAPGLSEVEGLGLGFIRQIYSPSTSVLGVHILLTVGTQYVSSRSFRSTLDSPLQSNDEALRLHFVKHVRRAHYMFALSHQPMSYSHELFVDKTRVHLAEMTEDLAAINEPPFADAESSMIGARSAWKQDDKPGLPDHIDSSYPLIAILDTWLSDATTSLSTPLELVSSN